MKKYVLLDNIRSLLNVGALFRTADGAGYDRIYLTGITPTPPRKEISKTALGAEEAVSWEFYEDPIVILKKLKSEGVTIIVLEQTSKSVLYAEVQEFAQEGYCLVLGNEVGGVSKEVLELADIAIEIPMHGIKKSLNVATAWGICMYKLMEISENLRV